MILLCTVVSCKRTEKPAPTAAAQVPATVITIRTNIEPGNRVLHSSIVVRGDLARSSDELDTWRLFDVKQNRITFVDDIGQTFRSEAMEAIVKKRREALTAPVPDGAPRVTVSRTAEKKTLLGQEATKLAIETGRYRRELWIANHPQIPAHLYSMMHASAPSLSPNAAIMKEVDMALFEVRGFPLVERAELPYGNGRMLIERTVVSVQQRDVPPAWLRVSSGYRDLAATGPAASPQPASSPLLDRKALEEGLRSFGRRRKTP